MVRVKRWLIAASVLGVAGVSAPGGSTAPERSEEIVEALRRRLETLSTYRCELHSLSILGTRREERTLEYAFQRPKLIRMRVLAGKDRGSTVVYRDGHVRGHRGGWLKWVVRTYAPSHPEVVTIRGGRIDQSDLFFIGDALQNAARAGQLRFDGMESLNGRPQYRLALLQHVAPLEDDAAAGRIWIDREQSVVSQYELYDKAGRLIYRQAHEKLELNVPLAEEMFQL